MSDEERESYSKMTDDEKMAMRIEKGIKIVEEESTDDTLAGK